MVFLANTTLKIWLIGSNIKAESTYLSQRLKQVEEKLHVHLELRLMPWNRAFDTVVATFKNDSAPDIFSTGTTWVRTLSYTNYLAPLPESFPIKPFLAPGLDESIRYNGKIYAVPFLAEVYVLMARQRVLDSVGIHAEDLSDWDSFFASCMKISDYYKARGVEHIPLAFPLRPESGTLHRFAVWLFRAGWTFPKLYPGMDRIFRNDISSMALEYVSKVVRAAGSDLKPLQTDTQSVMRQYFSTDNAYTFFVGNGADYVRDRVAGIRVNNLSLYPLPSLVPEAKTFGGGSVLAVSSTSRHQELAWEVAKYLTREEILMDLTAINGYIPPYKCSFWSEYGDDPNIRVLKDQYQNSTAYDNHPLWVVMEKTAGDDIAHYFWNSIVGNDTKQYDSADQMLENLDRKLFNLLNLMWEMQVNENG